MPTNPSGGDTADRLNHGCFCISLDRQALAQALDIEVGIAGFSAALANSHPSLSSNVPVFVSRAMMAAMEDVVAAVEAAAQLPGYRAATMTWAPAIATANFGPVGVLMGYDFHITEERHLAVTAVHVSSRNRVQPMHGQTCRGDLVPKDADCIRGERPQLGGSCRKRSGGNRPKSRHSARLALITKHC